MILRSVYRRRPVFNTVLGKFADSDVSLPIRKIPFFHFFSKKVCFHSKIVFIFTTKSVCRYIL